MERMRDFLDNEAGVRFLWWLIGGMLAVGFLIFLAVGANGPKDPALAARQHVEGFGTVGFSIEHGAVTDDFCALLAANDQQRQTGMMGRRDLAGYDAMVFAWPQPIEPNRVYFYNRKVPIALTVAWFAPDGKFVSSSDMDPCEDKDGCPTFRATGRWQFALEVPRGGLGRLGVAPGSVFKIKPSCST
jgi:uncharacterized membrane protein (UPF0127 family)